MLTDSSNDNISETLRQTQTKQEIVYLQNISMLFVQHLHRYDATLNAGDLSVSVSVSAKRSCSLSVVLSVSAERELALSAYFRFRPKVKKEHSVDLQWVVSEAIRSDQNRA